MHCGIKHGGTVLQIGQRPHTDGNNIVLYRSISVDLAPFVYDKTYSINNLTNVTTVKFSTNVCSRTCNVAVVV